MNNLNIIRHMKKLIILGLDFAEAEMMYVSGRLINLIHQSLLSYAF